MANDCLVTKLKRTVQNDALLKLGELKVEIGPGFNVNDNGNLYYVVDADPTGSIVLRVLSGDVLFSNGETILTPTFYNQGNSIWIAEINIGSVVGGSIGISRKYDAKKIYVGNSNTSKFIVSADDIVFLANNCQLTSYLNAVDGDLDVADLPTNFQIAGFNRSIVGLGIHGDATQILVNNAQDFDGKPHNNFFIETNITADLSLMNNFNQIRQGSNQVLSWKNTRPSSTPILTMVFGVVKLGNDIDAMLINQADCQIPDVPSDQKVISVTGTRTSASDAAVETLKGKGIAIWVNGTQL